MCSSRLKNHQSVLRNLGISITFTLVAVVSLLGETNADLKIVSRNEQSTINAVAGGKSPILTNAITAAMFNLNVSENYDSLYMFRGVNQIANTGVLSTTFNPVWHITSNDQFSIPLWYATAVGKTGSYGSYGYGMQNYRELDIPVFYTHSIGHWTLGAGYELISVFNAGPSMLRGGYLNSSGPAQQGLQHEISENIAYTFTNNYSID